MRHYWYQLSTIFLGIMLAGLVFIFYLLYKPYNVLTVSKTEIVSSQPLHAGDTLQYRVDYCKNMAIPMVVSKTLVNSILIPATPYISNVKVGCGSTVVSYDLPKFIDPGTYHIHIVSSARVNPLRDFVYFYETPEFEVIK